MEHEEKLTQEELAAEQEALKIPTEEEIRAKVIADFGFDEATDSDKIDKLTKKDLEDRKRLSKTIGQKVALREKLNKVPKEPAPAAKDDKKDDLSQKDVLFLAKANVHEDDLDQVLEYAKFKGIPVADALQSPIIKATLAENEEFRKTQAAANDGGSKRGAPNRTPQAILADIDNGIIPEKGSKEAEDAFWAKRGGKR